MVTKSILKVPIYDFTIYINIFDDWDEVSKYYNKIVNSNDEREGFLIINKDDITKLKFFVNSECPSCIIHEIVHIKNIIFDIIHYIPNSDNDEPEAYLVQYLYKEIFKVLEKHNKDITKK